jgi:hypothetical protein
MGNMQFDRQTLISAVTNKSVKVLQFTTNASLPAFTYERHILFSPKNTVSKVINVRMTWDALANTGFTGYRQLIMDNYIDDTHGLGIFRLQSSQLYKGLLFDQGDLQLSDGTHDSGAVLFPNDLGAINANIRSLSFDEVTGLSLVFYHGVSGVSLTETRTYTIFIEQEVVAR